MNIKLNLLADFLVNAVSEDSAPHFRSQYDKLIAERDTSDVLRQFALWFLVDKDYGVIRFTKPDSKQHAAIQRVARLYDENCKDRELSIRFSTAADDAADAFCAACDAAKAVAYAVDAALAVAYAVDAALAAAYAVDAKAARLSFYNRMAEKLLELLQLAPLKEII